MGRKYHAAACGTGFVSAFYTTSACLLHRVCLSFVTKTRLVICDPLSREGAIELMMRVYKSELPNLGGYLVHGADVHLGRVEQFIRKVGGACVLLVGVCITRLGVRGWADVHPRPYGTVHA